MSEAVFQMAPEPGVRLPQHKTRITPNAMALPSYDIFGIVESTTAGKDDKGPWLRFNGEFIAVTAEGQEFESGRCFLPPDGQAALFGDWSREFAKDARTRIQFAARIVERGKNEFGQPLYVTEWLNGPTLYQPLRMLRALIRQGSAS